jgi:Protein of unknown function (DUF3562)
LPAVVLDETFEKRMLQAETDVAREFGTYDRAVVHQHFEAVSGELLSTARVMDFVPVLAQKRVREILRTLPTSA